MFGQRGKSVGLLVNCGLLATAVGSVVDVGRVVQDAVSNPKVGPQVVHIASTPHRCDK
jgi:hypothetical protein